MRWGTLAIALAAVPTIAFADSTTVDLSSVLATPPTADYVEAAPSTAILDGPFSAQQYADFLTANGQDGSRVPALFSVDGFKRGYARTWVERGTRRVLIERVFELSAGTGAQTFYGQIKLGTQTATNFKGDIDTSAVPDSFGVKADEEGGTVHDFVALFIKGNAVYDVLMASMAEDLTAQVQTQVQAQYRAAPNETIPKSLWTNSVTGAVSVNAGFVTGAIIAGAIVLVLLLGAVVFIVLLARRSSRRAPVGLDMSPDGAYWWDGRLWHDAALEAPSAAPRSPDGGFWWDGRAWRPLPAAAPPGC